MRFGGIERDTHCIARGAGSLFASRMLIKGRDHFVADEDDS